MIPASIGSAIAYSHLLEATGRPHVQAHAEFEAALDRTPEVPAGQMTKEQMAEALARGMAARGEHPPLVAVP